MIFGFTIVAMLVLAAVAEMATLHTSTINTFAAETTVEASVAKFRKTQYLRQCLKAAMVAAVEIQGFKTVPCSPLAELPATSKETTMKTKLFTVAKVTGTIVEKAATKAAYSVMPRRQLLIELRLIEQALVTIANKGRSIPAQAHDDLIDKRHAVKECLAAG